MEMQTEKNVAQANITYSLVLKTELGKQLSGLTLRLVNALTGLAQQNTFAKIIAKLDQDLEAEKKAVEGPIHNVTTFPVTYKKHVVVIDTTTVVLLQLLSDLDKVAQRWYDLYFTGKMSPEEFEQKKQEWRGRFRHASLKVNAIKRRNGNNGANGREGKGAS